MGLWDEIMGNSESRSVRRHYQIGIREFLASAETFDKRPGASDSPVRNAISSTAHSLSYYDRNDELPRLLNWSHQQILEKHRLSSELATVTGRLRDSDSRNRDLTTQLRSTNESLSREIEQRRVDAELANAERRQLEQQHQVTLAQQQAAYSQQFQQAQVMHERALRDKQLQHDKVVAEYKTEIQKLRAQLLVSFDKNLAWPDEKLKIRLGEIRRLIDNATARLAAENLVPRQHPLTARLDPSQLLPRVQGKTHFWLRSMIWSKLQAAFFSLPYGFGAFGPGAGVAELLAIYGAWRARFDGTEHLNPRDTETFALFRKSAVSNKWRSITFHTLALNALDDALDSNSNNAAGNQSVLTQLGEQNRDDCVRQIMAFLNDLSAISSVNLYHELEGEVKTMARLSWQIAVQCGVNQAGLLLLTASIGDTVVIGPEYHDCEDGDEYRIATHVDFVVSPGLVRVGDGRGEMSRRYPVVPCEIFSSGD